MKFRVAIVTMVVALSGAVGHAPAQEGGEPAKGLNVALHLCAGCHAVRRGQEVSPNILAPPFERVANVPGMTAISLNHLLHSSHETMPNIMIPPEDQWHLVAYILSLRGR
jgi:mono/diheme cytochrome c family protein